MNLKNIRILVDGFNLGLRQGTGVKTYCIGLVKALQSLGAEVNILYDVSLSINNCSESIDNKTLFTKLNYQYLNYSAQLICLLKTLNNIPLDLQHLDSSKLLRSDIQRLINNDFGQMGILNIPLCYKFANFCFKRFKRSQTLILDRDIDIWHCTYPLPIEVRGAKKITTIHDLIPLRLPETTLDNKDFFYRLIQRSVETSDLIITVSENSKQDLIELFQCPESKIAVTYQTNTQKTNILSPQKISSLLIKYQLSYQKYILFVGAIEPKKNLGRLIEAYTKVDTNFPLVVAGKKGWLWKQDLAKISTLFGNNREGQTTNKQVIVLDYVTAEDLKYLYQGAYCLVFPSLYEGFGLPPLEAMTFGCPVITSNVSSLPEVCGDAALYIDPYDTDGIADTIERLTSDRSLRENLSQAGKIRADLFSQENYIKRLSLAYQKVLSSSKK